MKFQVMIPMDIYQVIEKSCESRSPEDLILKNGLIEEDRRSVKILCQPEQAMSLLSWANQKIAERSSLITITLDA